MCVKSYCHQCYNYLVRIKSITKNNLLPGVIFVVVFTSFKSCSIKGNGG